MARRNLGKAFAAVALSAIGIMFGIAAGACSAAGNNEGDTSNTGNGAGGSGNGDDGGLFGTSSGVGQDGGIGGGCASSQSKAQQVPLDMYIMLDQSGSMSDAAGNTTKWEATLSALKAFIQQPEAAGIGVGIQYFPLDSGGAACPLACDAQGKCPANCGSCVPIFNICSGGGSSDSCNVDDYAKPEVEIAALPGVQAALNTSMSNHSPGGGTPTSAALDGAIKHSQEWATAHPDHVVVTVLATDGDPANCDTNLANINAIAAAGANGVPKILTFVIGVGSSLNALNGIASAGGTNQAFLVDANANATQQFLDAMNEIRGSALACAYLIPLPAMGELDYDAVNVQYVPVGGEPIIIPKVNSKQDCPQSGNAWFYDNNATPKQIIMCDATCETIKKDKDGEVSVIFGCKTVVN